MSVFQTNPQAEANLTFDVVKPGTYQMRIEDVTEFISSKGNTCLKVKLSYADGNLEKLDGSGFAQNPGTIFDNSLVIAPPEKQGKTRQFVEALGKTWAGDVDTQDFIGLEVPAVVDVETYEGTQRNVVRRYIVAK